MARLPVPPPPTLDLAFFLDVDGTLIDLADSPADVVIDDALLGLVARLHSGCSGALALISGRALADIDRLLGSVVVPIAGQHGLERRDVFGRMHAHATAPRAKERIRRDLDATLHRYPQLLLEDKGLTLALHYRRMPQLAGHLHRRLRMLVETSGPGVCLQRGKCVLEIKPAGFDKGTAIAEFMLEPPFRDRRPVFIGDDATDEDGFALINRLGGVSIKAGHGRTRARYRLPDVAAVRRWLAQALTPAAKQGAHA